MKKIILAALVMALVGFLAPVTGEALASDGASLYGAKCQMCHGKGGAGTGMGPKLVGNDFVSGDASAIKGLITAGVPRSAKKYPQFPMAMPKVALSDAELDAIVTYLKGL